MSIKDISIQQADGKSITLKDFAGKVLLIVNTASRCGFTSQYEGLEQLYQRYKDQGFVVLAFPCNQFGGQEPEDNDAIQSFCKVNYHITFPVFAKIDVNGPQAHALFVHLKNQLPGLLGTEAIKWNFTKFLVGKNGETLKRFAPQDKPGSFEGFIQEALVMPVSSAS